MATTINPVNVRIGYDGSKLKAGVDASRSDLNLLGRVVRGSVSDFDQYKHKLDLLSLAYEKGAIDAKRYNEAVRSVYETHKQGMFTASPENQVNPILAGAMRFGGGLVAAGSIAGTAREMFRLTAEVESASVALEVLVGSATRANELIAEMKSLDARSPLAFIDLTQASKTLIGFGVDASKVMPIMERLGAVSLGNSEKFRSLSLAFGQVNAAGRLMGQEVLQFINAGFNPLQQISQDTGRSMAELKKAMEDGEISVAMVERAFENATSKGGRFDGMLEKMADTMSGRWSKAVSAAQKSAVEFGLAIKPIVDPMLDLTVVLTKSLEAPIEKLGILTRGITDLQDILSGNIGKRFFEDAAKQVAKLNDTDPVAILKKLEDEERIRKNAIKEREKLEKEANARIQKERAKDAMERLKDQRKQIDDMWEKGRRKIKEKEESERKLRQEVEQAERRFDPRANLVAEFQNLERLRAAGLDPLLVDREQGNLARKAAEDELADRKYGAVSAQAGSRQQWDILVEKQKGQAKEAEIAKVARQRMIDILIEIKNKPAGAILANARDRN